MQLGEITEPKIDQAGPPPIGEFTYVDISSVDNVAKRIVEPKVLPADSAPSRARQQLRSGDVLVSMTRPNLNAVALLPPELDGAIGSTGFHVLRARENVLPQWLYYGVQTRQFVGAMSELVQGALYPAVRPKDIRAFNLPVPELDEQRRIVTELEKQFSRLDEAVTNLKRVKANLKRYKTSVLKAAVEGRLVRTEAELARRDGRVIETGEQLLSRLLEKRKSLWKGRGKYAEPCPPDTADLPPLPEGWTYATAEQLTDPNRTISYGIIKLGPPVDGGIPVLRSSDVRSLRIDLQGIKTIAPSIAAEYRRTFLEGGEVIITVRGTLGGIAVAPIACRGFNVSREIAMLAMVEPELAYAVSQFIAAAPIQRWLMTRTKGIAYTGINIETLRALPLPVPPLHEQRRICAETERLLSLGSALDLEVESNIRRAQRLREVTLEHTFMGSL